MAPRSDDVDARVRHGGFLVGAERFDRTFFGVSPAEAAAMDPQQRLLLERGYEALHAAGHDRASLLGSNMGVFVGIAANDFAEVLKASPQGQSVYAATGAAHAIASGRLSYIFGLQGPCAAYDTACSSTLTACHAALRAVQLRRVRGGGGGGRQPDAAARRRPELRGGGHDLAARPLPHLRQPRRRVRARRGVCVSGARPRERGRLCVLAGQRCEVRRPQREPHRAQRAGAA